MTRNFRDLDDRLSPEVRRRVEERAQAVTYIRNPEPEITP
jgi:hypothetical protein